MRRLPAVLILVAVAACKRGSGTKGDACLALPAAVRDNLTAGPDGHSLYWLEREQQFRYDADLTGVSRLVHYDVRTGHSDVVFDDVSGPIRFIGGQLLAVRRTHDGTSTLVLLADDKHTQELTPSYLDIRDVEIIDAHTIAFLGDGDGARAVYVLGLDDLRPYPLVNADVLLTASDGRVFARNDDDVLAVDLKTRAVTKRPYIKKSMPQGASLVYVDQQRVLVHDMVSNASEPVITPQRDWKLVYQGETTLARTPPEADRSYAVLVAGRTATPLPTIIGGASILSTTTLGRETWALIGHDTTNYEGDLAQTNAESDVCHLPASGELAVPTRVVPARYADRAAALFEALAATAPAATLQIRDEDDAPPSVFIHLLKEWGGRDLESMRKRARDLDNRVTHILRDREVRTDVMFADRRRAVHRWKRDRARYRTTVGMGDALVADPADFDFEVSNVDNQKKDDTITCSGTLRNATHRALAGVDIKCSGNRSHLIHIDKLGPDESRTFSQTFEVSDDGEAAYLEILLDGTPTEPLDTEVVSRTQEVFTVATDAFAASGLWLESHDLNQRDIRVSLEADRAFANKDAATQQAALEAAYGHYVRLRGIYHMEADTTVSLHVTVQLSDLTFDYDGTTFERD